MKRTTAPQKEGTKQMSLLEVDTRDPGQVMADLEKQRDLISRCLTLGEEIIALLDKDAALLLQDIRASEPLGIEEMTKAMGKRNGHLSEKFHKDFSVIFGRALRDMNEGSLTYLRDCLTAMDEVTISVFPAATKPPG